MARPRIRLCLGMLLLGPGVAQAPLLPDAGLDPPGASGWRTVTGPEGERIELAPGFQARFQERGSVQVLGQRGILGPGVPYVIIQPFIGTPGESAAGRLRRAVLPHLRQLSTFALERFVSYGPGSAALRARYSLGDVPRQVVALAALQGRAGMTFLLSAPFQGFDQTRNTLTRIAMSLRYGTPEEPVDPLEGLAFKAWQEPVEGAFGLEVPAGWEVQGGLVRRGPLDLACWVLLVAPDRGVELFLNDRRNRLFLEPEPSLVAAGFHEGRWFSPAAGQRLHVLGYLPGTRYLTGFLWPAGGPAWERQILLEDGLPAAAERLAALQPGPGSPEVEAGHLLAVGLPGQEPWRSSFIVATRRWRGADGTRTWTPLGVLGWNVRPGREELADRVLRRVASSFQVTETWAEAEGGLGQAGARALAATLRELARALEESFPRRQHELARRLGPVLGPGHERDEATGDLFFQARGHNYYWLHVPSLAEGREQPDVDLTPLADL